MTAEEKDFLESMGMEGTLRKMLTTQEKKIANKLVKENLLMKGTSDDKHKSILYYVESSLYGKLFY